MAAMASTPEGSSEKDVSPGLVTTYGTRPGHDLESHFSQKQLQVTKTTAYASEYRVPSRTKFSSLGIWLLLNLILTLHSKTILGEFSFPWLLTSLHTATTAIGCYSLKVTGYIKPTPLSLRENLALMLFSTLFTLNIAISNVSLSLVSMSFHQLFRATVPVFTIILSRLYFLRTYSRQSYLSLIPIILGVAMATYGNYSFTRAGFSLTLLGVMLAALKTVISNHLMTGTLALPALEILLRMTPLAALQSVAFAVLTSEQQLFQRYVEDGLLTRSRVLALLGNCLVAFLLNISSFHANKVAGALTMTVGGNVKQVLTVLLGVVYFDGRVEVWNGLGMLVTFVGVACYSCIELGWRRTWVDDEEKRVLF